jgi:hypothetical protein
MESSSFPTGSQKGKSAIAAFVRLLPLNPEITLYAFSRSQLHYIAGRNCVPELPLMNDGSPSPPGRGTG